MPKLVSGRVVKTRWPGRHRPHFRGSLDRQVELGALGPADPVALHGLDPLGPVQAVEVVEQLVGVVGDLEEPLLQVALGTRSPDRSQVPSARTCSLASTVWQPGHQLTGASAVGQAGLQEPQEDPLGPADVVRVVAADLRRQS